MILSTQMRKEGERGGRAVTYLFEFGKGHSDPVSPLRGGAASKGTEVKGSRPGCMEPRRKPKWGESPSSKQCGETASVRHKT